MPATALRISLLLHALPFLFVLIGCSDSPFRLDYYTLRDRVVVLDEVVLKKALYISFRLTRPVAEDEVPVVGELFKGPYCIAKTENLFRENTCADLVFDLPYDLPGGLYTLLLTASTEGPDMKWTTDLWFPPTSGAPFNEATKNSKIPDMDEHNVQSRIFAFEHKNTKDARDFALLLCSPLEYAMPERLPDEYEKIDSLSITAARNEFEPISFALLPHRDLGTVYIRAEDLSSAESTIPSRNVRIAHVEDVEDTTGLETSVFRRLPALIVPVDKTVLRKDQIHRFWITIRIDPSTPPGRYRGSLMLNSKDTTGSWRIPLEVDVSPILLEEVPNVDYFMLMTYEFVELTMPWSKKEKKKILESARKVLRNYREHGMTMLCIHSPFLLTRRTSGEYILEDVCAALTAAKEAGFQRPLIWYLGHLINTAKPRHPGNICNFDSSIHIPRLMDLVGIVSQYARRNNCPPVIVLPIDEPDDLGQSYLGKRKTVTPALLQALHETGAKTMLTLARYTLMPELDYACVSQISESDLNLARDNGTVYLAYENTITMQSTNPAYARYIFGYYTWKNHLNGMTCWTFQNTQNAGGLPERCDTLTRDIYLAYPHRDGPRATLKWEAIREGIDDYKLIYQLQKRIKLLAEQNIDAPDFQHLLAQIITIPQPQLHSFDINTKQALVFRNIRDDLMSAIVAADKVLEDHKKPLSATCHANSAISKI